MSLSGLLALAKSPLLTKLKKHMLTLENGLRHMSMKLQQNTPEFSMVVQLTPRTALSSLNSKTLMDSSLVELP